MNCVCLLICKCLNLVMFINVLNILVMERKLLCKYIKFFIKFVVESDGFND